MDSHIQSCKNRRIRKGREVKQTIDFRTMGIPSTVNGEHSELDFKIAINTAISGEGFAHPIAIDDILKISMKNGYVTVWYKRIENNIPCEVDEDTIEKAYWDFDAERKKTGMERDSFKHQMRMAIRHSGKGK